MLFKKNNFNRTTVIYHSPWTIDDVILSQNLNRNYSLFRSINIEQLSE